MKPSSPSFVLLTLTCATMAADPAHRVPRDLFAGDERGPWQTGTVEELWIDPSRQEKTTSDPDDSRRVMVQLWYPARWEGEPPRAPYVLHPELYAEDHWLHGVKHVRTTSVENAAPAPVPEGTTGFPVLLYNHGGGHPHFSATFQTEFLASHGYVVASLGHTGGNGIQRFPDGAQYVEDVPSARPRLTEEERKRMTVLEQYEWGWKQPDDPLRQEDMRFVLDELARCHTREGHRWHQRLDLERVGALGWSSGGVASLQASYEDPRVKAAVNQDGVLHEYSVTDHGTPRPVMIFGGGGPSLLGEADADWEELGAAANTRFWRMLTRSKGDWYRVALERSNHGTYSDHPLFHPRRPSEIHPRLAHEAICRITLQFFDKYLRGADKSPLLDGTESYPEAKVMRKRQLKPPSENGR